MCEDEKTYLFTVNPDEMYDLIKGRMEVKRKTTALSIVGAIFLILGAGLLIYVGLIPDYPLYFEDISANVVMVDSNNEATLNDYNLTRTSGGENYIGEMLWPGALLLVALIIFALSYNSDLERRENAETEVERIIAEYTLNPDLEEKTD